jgi:O-acetyl-ADP-ribose deacetylase (regulator of RNase III)
MLTYVRGNLFDSPAKVLVNTVNTVGVMGKGIARTFKAIYPEMFTAYVKLCESKQFDIGNLWLYRTGHKWVLNFPTKKNWRSPSQLDYIEAGLKKFVDTYTEQNVTSIAFPQLGCGNGELNWEDVEPLMVRYLRPLRINVFVYLYEREANARVEHKDLEEMSRWLRTEPRTLPFDEFWTDVKNVVRTHSPFKKHNNGQPYIAEIVKYDQEGLQLYFGDRTRWQAFRDSVRKVANQTLARWRFTSDRGVFVPEDSLLELWQSIRFYGFCYSQTIPAGLEALKDYLLPIIGELPYLRPAMLMAPGDTSSTLERGFQLYVPESASEPKEEAVEPVSA